MKRLLIFAILMIVEILTIHAQSFADPVLTGVIVTNTPRKSDALRAQSTVSGIMAGEYMTGDKYINKTRQYLEEYNNYLDTLQSYVGAVCKVYSLYLEGERLVRNTRFLKDELSSAPDNALAVFLKGQLGGADFYSDIIRTAVDLTNDMMTAFAVGSKSNKMSEYDRYLVLKALPSKIHELGTKMHRLGVSIRYTTIDALWRDLLGIESHYSRDRVGVVNKAYDRWSRNAGSASKRHTHSMPESEGFVKTSEPTRDKTTAEKIEDILNNFK